MPKAIRAAATVFGMVFGIVLGIAVLAAAWAMYRTPVLSMMLSGTAFCG